MKQVVLCSLLLGSLLIGFGACSSDEPEIMGPALADVNGDYQSGSGSKALEIYYSDKILNGSNRTVTFSSEDKQTAIITLKNVIPGMELLELPEVLLASSKEQTQFLFSGTCTKTDCMVKYDGTVEKGKLSLSLSVKLAANDDVVGRWVLQDIKKKDDIYEEKPVHFIWTTTDEFPGFKKVIAPGYPAIIIPCNNVAENLSTGLSEYVKKENLIKEITLTADGNMKMLYASGSEWQESELNMLQYYISNDRLYLQINSSMLNSLADNTAFNILLKNLLQEYTNGIPFAFYTTESGKLQLLLDNELLCSDGWLSIIPYLKGALPEELNSLPFLEEVLENYSTAIKATTKIQLGLNFSQVKQGAK